MSKNVLMRRPQRRRGVSLALSLLVIALLLTLGSAFLGFTYSESRSSRFLQESTFAQRAAQWGLGYFLSYMAVPGAWRTINVPLDATDTNSPTIPGYSLRVNGGTGGGPNFPQTWNLKGLEIYGTDAGGNKEIPVGKEPPAELGDLTNVKPEDIRYLRVSPALELPRDGLNAFVEGWVVTLRSGTKHLPPLQPEQYLVAVRSNVLKAGSSGEGRKRMVLARVRESMATDYAVFQSNMASWDRFGFHLLDFSSSVVLPKGFSVMGRLRVDGLLSQISSDTTTQSTIASQSGVLQFESSNASDYSFLRDVTWQSQPGSPTTAKTHAGMTNNTAGYEAMFKKGYTWFPPLGLPGTDSYLAHWNTSLQSQGGTARLVASWTKDGSDVSGVVPDLPMGPMVGIQTGASSFVKADGSSSASTDRFAVGFRWPYSGSGVPGAFDFSTSQQPGVNAASGGLGANLATNIPYLQHTAPLFATLTIEIKGDKVFLTRKDAFGRPDTGLALPGATASETQSTGIQISRIRGRTLYVEGGNVEVKASEVNNGLNGLLTIVCSEHRDRQLLRPPSPTGSADSATEKTIFLNAGTWASSLPATNGYGPWRMTINGQVRWLWPTAAGAQVGTTGVLRAGDPEFDSGRTADARFHARAKEGNIIIADHIRYKPATRSALGLIAENYIFLPDAATYKSQTNGLEVQGVLTSLKHSLQYRDWSQLESAASSRQNVRLSFTGSLVSRFPDVIGLRSNQMGFYSQMYKHDANLKTLLPPNYPLWDRTSTVFTKRPVEFVVVTMEDQSRQGERQ